MGALDVMGICPYYKRETKKSIVCEGACIRPLDRDMKVELCYNRCADNWHDCQIKEALDHYYERIEKKENH